MIKTVFYFTGTEQEYIALHRAGEISPNTIVLCKDTHSLWRNGERYGVGSTSEGGDYVPYDDTALTERIDQIVEELQQLTEQIGQSGKGMTDEEKQQMQDLADQLIVIGDGLDTANEVAAAEKERLNGLLDGIQQSINDMLEQAEQDNASIQQLVSDVQNQAAAIQEHAEWIQNREEEDSTSWKSGWNANIEAYLQEVGVWARDNGITETQFTQLSQSVDTISSSVNNLQEDVETVKTQFSNISQTADSIETRVASVEQDLDTKATKSQVSELSQTVNGFSTRVSNVETDVAGKVGSTEFSTLSQRVNSIDLAVQALTPSEDGSISDQMQATIEQAVRDGVAELNLSSTYAKKSTEEDLAATQQDLENAEKVLEWMYSGLKLSTTPDKTTSELASAGKDALNSAISDLRTYVQKLKNGDYVASSSITSAVNNAIASLYSQAGNNNAKSLIFSKITSNENSISGLQNDVSDIDNTVDQIQSDLSDGLDQINQNTQDIAAIVTAATGDSTSATIATKFSNWKSGLASKSDVESATASLVSSDVFDNTVADLVTKTELNQATSTLAAKTTVENQGTRLSSVETKADQNEATLTNLTKSDGPIAKVIQKATDTEAAISGLVQASTGTVTASKIWGSLASDDSVMSSMRSQFATTVDGDGIASLVKEDIAQSVNNSTWDQWVSYMKGDVATAVNNYQTATANKAQWDAVVAYVDGKKTAIESIDDLDNSVSNLSTSLAGVSSSVGDLEDEVTGIKNNYAQSSMFASIKDTQGKVTAASIVAAVNGSSGTSKVQIDADHIDVSGVLTVANNAASAANAAQSTADSALTAATTIDGASIKTGTINADRLDISKIVGKINSSTGDSKLVINADHVDVSGVLTIANNAADAADAAQTTANSAANAASAAQSTADSAVSAASAAQNTADSALTATTTIDGGNITTGTINSDRLNIGTIVGKINGSTGTSKVTIDADHIQLNGQAVVNSINNGTTTINGGKIDATDLVAVKLAATYGTIGGWTIGTNTLSSSVNGGTATLFQGGIEFKDTTKNNTLMIDPFGLVSSDQNGTTNVINTDGSGSLARGNLSWTAAGALTATNIAVNGGTIGGFTIGEHLLSASNSAIQLTSSNYAITLNTVGLICTAADGSTAYTGIYANGAGFLAKGNITWDVNGNISKLKTIQSNYVAAFESGKLSFTNTDSGHDGDLIEINSGGISLYNEDYTTTIHPGEINTNSIQAGDITAGGDISADGDVSVGGTITCDKLAATNGAIEIQEGSYLTIKSAGQNVISLGDDGIIECSEVDVVNVYANGEISAGEELLVGDSAAAYAGITPSRITVHGSNNHSTFITNEQISTGEIYATDNISTAGNISTTGSISGVGLDVKNSSGSDGVSISPSSIKVTKNGTTGTGVTQSFSIKATGTYNGQQSDYLLTLTFTNGILTGYNTGGFPGSTTA